MKKSNLSIKVIYWITQIAFWLFNAVGVFALILSILLIFSLIGPTQLNVGVPIAVNILERGTLDVMNLEISTQLVEMTGKIHLIDTPFQLARIYGVFILLILSMFYFIMWTFRKFIINVYRGKYFDLKNIFLLKRIAYALAGVWVFTVIYSYFQYFFIVQNLTFHSVELTADVKTYPVVLIVALFIWVLSHIFMKGVELQEENDYTI